MKLRITPNVILTCTILLVTILSLFPNSQDVKEPIKVTNLIVFSMLMIPVIGAVCLTLTARGRSRNLIMRRSDLLVLLLLIYILANRFIQQPQAGLSLNSMELIYLVLFYFANSRLPEKLSEHLMIGIMICGLIEVTIGYSQFFALTASNHKLFRITGSFNNPGPFSGYIAMAISLAISGIINKYSREFKSINLWKSHAEVLMYLIVVFGIPILILSHSRAAILAVTIVFLVNIASCIPALLRSYGKAYSILKVCTFIGLTSFLLATTIWLYHLNVDSGNGRLLIWKICKNIFLDNVVNGIGYDNIKMFYMSYQQNYFAHAGTEKEQLVAGNVSYVFNEYIQFVVENGIIGILYLCYVIIVLVNCCRRSLENKNLVVAMSGLASICTFAFFSYPSDILPIKVVLILLISMLAKTDSKILTHNYRGEKPNILYLGTVLIVFIGVSYLIVIKTLRIYDNYRDWKVAEHYYIKQDYLKSAVLYHNLYNNFNNNGNFLTSYGKTLSMSINNEEAIKVLERAVVFENSVNVQISLGNVYRDKKMFASAEKCYINASHMVPEMFYPRYLCARLYFETGEYSKATEAAQFIIKKKQKVRSPAVRQMKLEMNFILEQVKKYQSR